MKLEHTAYNVAEPKAQANWYVENLGMTLVRDIPTAPFITFIGDDAGGLIELYANPNADIPDYHSMSPYILHLAFLSEDIEADKAKLLSAGATDTGIAETLPTGDEYVFVRDPWGVSVQLIKRSAPLV